MTEPASDNSEIFQFVFAEIDSVPHLEALLLLRNSRPTVWTAEELARRLYVSPDFTKNLLLDLVRKGLIHKVQNPTEGYCYSVAEEAKDDLIGRLDEMYRREVVRISTMIHSKPSSAVRDFARAFRFTKEKDKD